MPARKSFLIILYLLYLFFFSFFLFSYFSSSSSSSASCSETFNSLLVFIIHIYIYRWYQGKTFRRVYFSISEHLLIKELMIFNAYIYICCNKRICRQVFLGLMGRRKMRDDLEWFKSLKNASNKYISRQRVVLYWTYYCVVARQIENVFPPCWVIQKNKPKKNT